ncbi:hypothetical protein RIF29_39346 [Crotalaria pallida]|uniref:Uncharacterized protein n=1 Tax=Crotalaria pallida TaxID=3830 RepID=A0AAN9E420_CROPI
MKILINLYPCCSQDSSTGNIESHEAQSMIRHIEDVLFKCPKPLWQPLFSSQHLTNQIVKLDSGMNYFYPSEGW